MLPDLLVDIPVAQNEEILHFYPQRELRTAPKPSAFSKSAVGLGVKAISGSPNFLARRLPNKSCLAISKSGDHIFLSNDELALLSLDPQALPLNRLANLQSRFFIPTSRSDDGMLRLLDARRGAKRETVDAGPSLHIIVPTLKCAHSCQYCQVSRSLDDDGHTMSIDDLDAVCDSIFESKAEALTVEFQGGDPLLRFDLVEHAIRRIHARNSIEKRRLRFVIASTLHQLTEEMCSFFRMFEVVLSVSLDGPAWLHNKNRPVPSRDAYERTLAGIELARDRLGHDAVSALMTTTKLSLLHPEAIVDEYVRLGFQDIFLRPLSSYGFAKRNQTRQGYSLEDFFDFYSRALQRIFYWNKQGIVIREVYASIILNKMLSTFDGGYVDLQSPTGSGASVLAYNYDGYVYPSDEARMLVEAGDTTLRLGKIGTSQSELLRSAVRRMLVDASTTENISECRECAYNQFCAPNPVDSYAQHADAFAPVLTSEHCRRHMWLFDEFFTMLQEADDFTLDLFYRWAVPAGDARTSCVA